MFKASPGLDQSRSQDAFHAPPINKTGGYLWLLVFSNIFDNAISLRPVYYDKNEENRIRTIVYTLVRPTVSTTAYICKNRAIAKLEHRFSFQSSRNGSFSRLMLMSQNHFLLFFYFFNLSSD